MALYESLKSHCFGIYSIFLLGCCTSWRTSPLQGMGDGKKYYTRAVGIIILKGYLAVLQRSFTYSMQTGVCGVQHRCLVSKRHGRRQLYVSGMQVFQLVFTLSTGKQIFFFFPWWRRKRQWEVKKEEGSPTVISQNGRGEELNPCLHIQLAQLSFASINQMVRTWDVFLSPVKTASSFLTYGDCVSTPGVLGCKL